MIRYHAARVARDVKGRVRPLLRRVSSAVRPTPQPPSRADPPAGPKVSIIVPIYAVEQYLSDCLDSLVNQTHENVQIIVVDDGSPDKSFEIAEAFALRDRRVEIVRQENRGLGAARNAGLKFVEGEFVTFVDSDDTIPRAAIAVLVASLSKSGSDFAIGTAQRFNSEREWTPAWARSVHGKDQFRLSLAEFPEILKDVFVCNKLFRTDFFRATVGSFPERIRYEDQEPTARAYSSGTFDVLKEVVYNWRMREDGTSITQQKSNPDDLADRLLVKKRVATIFEREATPEVFSSWLAKAIGFDLRPYYEQVPRTDETYWQSLREGVLSFRDLVTPQVWNTIPMADRLPALAVMAGSRRDVTQALVRRDEYGWRYPGRVVDDRVILDDQYLSDWESAPDSALLEFSPSETELVARIQRLSWSGSELLVEGYAYIDGVDLHLDDSALAITVVRTDTQLSLPLEVKRVEKPEIDQNSPDAWNTHNASGFVATVDSRLLEPHSQMADEGETWQFTIDVSVGGVRRTGPVLRRDPEGLTSTLPVQEATQSGRWVLGVDGEQGLTLRYKSNLNIRLTGLEVRGTTVRFSVATPGVSKLVLGSKGTPDVVCRPDQGDGPVRAFTARLPDLPIDALDQERVWRINGDVQGHQRRVTWIGSSDALGAASPTHERVMAACSRVGTVRLHQNDWWANVSEVTLGDDSRSLVVSGELSAPNALEYRARLASDVRTIFADLKVNAESGQFRATFPLQADGDWASSVAIENVGFSFRLATKGPGGALDERWIPVAEKLQKSLPRDLDGQLNGITLSRTRSAAALWVKFRLPFLPRERGRRTQRLLHERYAGPDAHNEPADAVLFESFNGRQFTDSSLELFKVLQRRRPDLTLFWSVRDLSQPCPDGATPLLMHSEAWIRAVHSCKYLVNNNNFPFYFRKQSFQRYIQVWHGTPLKRIGNDVPAGNLSLSYRELMAREASGWDLLLAQNDFAAKVLPRAFGYEGEVLSVGYPRNDSLKAAATAKTRTEVRARLGVADDQTLVLYAPTWRDTAKNASGRYSFVQHFDFEQASATLGDRVKFLVRGHANTVHGMGEQSDSDLVLDVSTYPQVNDLMLAADVLVTDYSSIMFDFCVTGKPIIYLTPDLEHYRDTVRGFYLDLESICPGPICRTTDEVAALLKDPAHIMDDYQGSYAEFVSIYAPNDDGFAGARVAEQIWDLQDLAETRVGTAPMAE